jgi:hypothetical protein
MRGRHPLALLAAALLLAACGEDEKQASHWDPGPPCDVFVDAGCLDVGRILADVETLAAPAWKGRRAGTPGNDAATALVAQRFERSGLSPGEGRAGFTHAFPLPVWIPEGEPALSVAGTPVALGRGLELVEFSGSGSVTDAELVFAGYGLRVPAGYSTASYPDCPIDPATGYDDLAGLDLAGKIVVLLRGGYPAGTADEERGWLCPFSCVSPGCTTTHARIARVAAARAAAVLLSSADPASTRTADFVRLGSPGPAIPVLQLARDRLHAAVPAIATWQAETDATLAPSSHATGVRATLSVRGRTEERAPVNVIGVVPGFDPALRDEVVVIGAHVDHMGELPFRDVFYPGADDNASGTAVVLELARAVTRSETQPRRTLVFAAWNAEELGLVGSFAYVDAPLHPLDRTVAAFSVDMVGDGEPGLLVYGGLDHPGIVETMEAGAAMLGLPPWPILPVPASSGSDHAPFAFAGVPAVLLLTPRFEDHLAYHSPGDTPAVVSAETLEAAAKLAWAAVRPLARGDEPPAAAAATAALRAAAQEPAPVRGPACFGPRPGLADPLDDE